MTMEATTNYKDENTFLSVATQKRTEPLRECVRDALDSYFGQMDGHSIVNLYRLVLSEMEQPLFETVMRQTQGNQSRAAEILGISRSTLRKKLAMYEID